MQTSIYNDWYVRTDNKIGPYTITASQQPTAEQIHNATKVYDYFSALGWSLSAICGMIGNMCHESTLDPAFIQSNYRNRLPNSAADLSDVPNSVMLNFYAYYYTHDPDRRRGCGIGLVQWDGPNSQNPPEQKLVSFAERYNMIWYDGDTQLYRIQREKETNIQWQTKTYYGITWTWSNYVTNTRSPEDSARIWCGCYEVSSGINERKGNARWFYDYFQDIPPVPPTPDAWIYGTDFAALAVAYDPDITGVQIPYSQMDCIKFVQTVWRDIQAVSSSDKLCSPLGTNTLWRTNTSAYPNLVKTFGTTSPDSQYPCPVLWYKDTISNCISMYGDIPAGSLLLHQISEAGPPAIPSQYAGDGIGNFAHIGIYIGNNEVMQSGGMDSGSVPGGGVHRSTYNPNAWNYVAWVVYVDPSGYVPPPPPPPVPDVPYWLYLWYTMNRKKVTKNVKRSI